MVVYLLCSNWMYNGDNAVNEIIGIYDCLPKAQHALIDCLKKDLQHSSYNYFRSNDDTLTNISDIPDLLEKLCTNNCTLSNIESAKIWNGDDETFCEDYQSYHIEKHLVM